MKQETLNYIQKFYDDITESYLYAKSSCNYQKADFLRGSKNAVLQILKYIEKNEEIEK